MPTVSFELANQNTPSAFAQEAVAFSLRRGSRSIFKPDGASSVSTSLAPRPSSELSPRKSQGALLRPSQEGTL